MELIRTIRNIRSEYNVEPGKRIPAHIAAGEHLPVLKKHAEIVAALGRLDEQALRMEASLPKKPDGCIAQVISGGVEVHLPLAGMIDLDAERSRAQKELAQLEGWIAASKAKLNNKGFTEKAPPAVVAKERDKLADLELQAAKVQQRLQGLG
jgi:valyl-tRNA synthetase